MTYTHCKKCRKELKLGHRLIGICSYCVKAEKEKIKRIPRPNYGGRNDRRED